MPSLTLQSLLAEINEFRASVPRTLRQAGITASLADQVERAIAFSDSPFSLAIVGQMKVGKSSLINALLGTQRARIGVTETTATLNKFSYGHASQANVFRVIWDQIPESYKTTASVTSSDTSRPSNILDCARLAEWDGDSEVAQMTHLLEFVSDADFLKRVVIYDTPGMQSTIVDHASKSAAILRSENITVDCIIYVIGPNSHGRDEDALRDFAAATRLVNATPYNAIAVLNGWEKLTKSEPPPWIACLEKAKNTFSQLRSHVACVIPVSGPWGFAAKALPDVFWEQVVKFTLSIPSKILSDLVAKEKNYFDPDEVSGSFTVEDRRDLFRSSGLPFRSFTVLLRFAAAGCFTDGSKLRGGVLKASGINELMECIESRLLSRSHIIRASSVLFNAMQPTERGIQVMRSRITDLENQIMEAKRALAELKDLGTKVDHTRQFVTNAANDVTQEVATLTRHLSNLEVQRRNVLDSRQHFDRDLAALSALDEYPDCVKSDESDEIRHLFGVYGCEATDRLKSYGIDHASLAAKAESRLRYWISEFHRSDISEVESATRRAVLAQVISRLEGLIEIIGLDAIASTK